ncbi:MAG: RNA polymerase subunit sigma-70 [Bacteroidetes bacterium]|nr:MAG: RNA polymerase subunit sigma-70 [Bacteroidota bacterium]
MQLKDQHISRQIRKGDIRSFEGLFHRFYQALMRYALTMVKKQEIAEEVVQDVFYNIWKNKEALRITRSWNTYLYRAVYNNSMMVLRKSGREVLRSDCCLPETGDHGTGSPETIFMEKEIAGVVERALQSLPERTREIYRLNRQEGLKYKEIAEQLAISVKTVEANMSKALKALKTGLKAYGLDQSNN